MASGTRNGIRLTSGVLAEGTPWQTLYHVIEAEAGAVTAGPTLLVIAGVHGDEPAGARAAEQIRHWPLVRGSLVVVPRANAPGLHANKRGLPGEPEGRCDLNRNFPRDTASDAARGEAARAIWRFVRQRKPDWILDLHEGKAFRVSHEPAAGERKSVGSSVIYFKDPALDPIARRMRDAANATEADPERQFVLIDRGPFSGGLVSACVRHLGMRGMILETTYNHQPVSLRTRQHRAMVGVVMRHLGMIDRGCDDVMVPADRSDGIVVGLYDGRGTGGRGVRNLVGMLDRTSEMTVHHLGPMDLRRAVLRQFDVVLFPGGSGKAQAAAIGAEGKQSVREFVREGGGYLGICGGAYLCSAQYDWSLKLVDAHVFTGTREIKGHGPQRMFRRGKSTTVKMEFTEEGRRMFKGVPRHTDVRFHNGPVLSSANDPDLAPYTTLAHYRSEQVMWEPQRGTMIDSPAIVSGTYGAGRVIAISPHPERTDGLESIVTDSIRWLAAGRHP